MWSLHNFFLILFIFFSGPLGKLYGTRTSPNHHSHFCSSSFYSVIPINTSVPHTFFLYFYFFFFCFFFLQLGSVPFPVDGGILHLIIPWPESHPEDAPKLPTVTAVRSTPYCWYWVILFGLWFRILSIEGFDGNWFSIFLYFWTV